MKDIITRYGQQSHHITKLDKPLQVQVKYQKQVLIYFFLTIY